MLENGYALQDIYIEQRIKQIVTDHKVKVIVETGVNNGGSTKIFAGMVDTVIGIENDLHCFETTYGKVSVSGRGDGLVLVYGNSPDVLKALSSLLPNNTIYFLDAHWGGYWPILDEIKAIKPGTGVIVIHDILVPDNPFMGYDSYNGQALCYEYLKPALDQWCPKYAIEYNSMSTAHSRGVAYIFPTPEVVKSEV